MKNIILYTLTLLFTSISLSSCVSMQSPKQNIKFPISDPWKFRRADTEEWLPATVPGTVHTDLLALDSIDDPYYRLNEKKQQWIDKQDWEYQCEFSITDELLDKREIFLKFYGLDTYAQVKLNGQDILSADNMFRTWVIPVKSHLRPGVNILNIRFASPTRVGLEALAKHGYGLPASNDQSENGELGDQKVSVFTRKAGYHYGWDWGPRLVTTGIWRPVELVAYDRVSINNVHIVQATLNDTEAQLLAKVEVESSQDENTRVAIVVDGQVVATRESPLHAGVQLVEVPFKIPNPQRWWPNGLGDQKLYSIEVRLGDKAPYDQVTERIGLRTIEVIQQEDADGQGKSFYFKVNDRPVFAKGANYIPNDLFLPRVSKNTYEEILGAAEEANMNMIRVWGGGVYEDDYFYQLCDEKGLLVWQDFMFACSMYPGDQDFLDNVKKEAIDNVKRLRNHPCIALWCGNNEIETAWGEYLEHAGWGWKQQYSAEQRKTIWNDYEKVFHQILPDVIKTYTHGDFYWKSSPTAGDKMLATYESRSGDMHYWGVWHGKHPFTDFDTYVGRFMSEYGFQSFPLLSSVKKYTTIDDWDIESEVMASHQRSGIGNLRIKEYMSDGYQVPNDFEQFLYVGQVLQADGIRYAIEAHRKNMPYCMGSLYWQLNDCWPVASWSSIDYYGKWKALQYTAKEAFKNQIISIWTEGDTINIYGISDLEIDQDAILQVELIDYSGKAQWKEEIKFILKGNNSTLIYSKRKGDLLFGNNPDQMILAAHLISQGDTLDRALFDFVLPKQLKLKSPSIDLTWNDDQLSVSTDTYVKGLYLDILGWEGRFSDNFFDLIPTEPKILHWSGALDDRQRDALKYLHLQQTTMNE